MIREWVSTGAAGAQTQRSLGHHLLHPQILRLLVLLKPADLEDQSSLLKNRPHPQIQISNACPADSALLSQNIQAREIATEPVCDTEFCHLCYKKLKTWD